MAKKPTKKESIEQDYDRWNTVPGTMYAIKPGEKLMTPRAKDFGTPNSPLKRAAQKPAARKK